MGSEQAPASRTCSLKSRSMEDLYSANIMRGSKHVCVNSFAPLLRATRLISVSRVTTVFQRHVRPIKAVSLEHMVSKDERGQAGYLVRLTVVPSGKRDLRQHVNSLHS